LGQIDPYWNELNAINASVHIEIIKLLKKCFSRRLLLSGRYRKWMMSGLLNVWVEKLASPHLFQPA